MLGAAVQPARVLENAAKYLRLDEEEVVVCYPAGAECILRVEFADGDSGACHGIGDVGRDDDDGVDDVD